MSMSEHANNVRNFSQAIEHCKEALKYTPDDSSAMTLLARLYTQVCFTSIHFTTRIKMYFNFKIDKQHC